jgi:two-component system invasion response regulator UvrY
MNATKPMSVLITDNHALMRQCWSFVLNENKKFRVIAECSCAEEAIEVSRELRPDIIVMEVNLPESDGIEATRTIKEILPDARVLGVSLHAHPSYASRMMRAGALGYITKNSTVKEMFQALSEVSTGKKFICREVVDLISENFVTGGRTTSLLNSLTRRESDIVSLIYKGYTSKQIAETLFMSIRTVSAHRYNIFQKLKIKKSVSLINLVNQHPGFL